MNKAYVRRECERCLKETMTRKAKWGKKTHYLCESCIKAIKEFKGNVE